MWNTDKRKKQRHIRGKVVVGGAFHLLHRRASFPEEGKTQETGAFVLLNDSFLTLVTFKWNHGSPFGITHLPSFTSKGKILNFIFKSPAKCFEHSEVCFAIHSLKAHSFL